MSITPTVGRVVWYYPDEPHIVTNGRDPLDAHVVGVISETVINIAFFDFEGYLHRKTSVPLVPDDQTPALGDGVASWMPYQAAQAKKNAAELSAGSQLSA